MMIHRIFAITLFIGTTLLVNNLQSQTQLFVEGTSIASSEPVAEISTGATSGTLSLGLKVLAVSNTTGFGVGGQFIGSTSGVVGQGFNAAGVQGGSEAGYGVEGTSENSYGGYFLNKMKTQPDLVVGGNSLNANGIIASDPGFSGSSLFLRSNNSLLLQLDHNNNSDGFFTIQNGTGSAVLVVGEQGDMALAGNSEASRPQLLLRETETTDYARFRLQNDSNGDYWDIAGGGVNNGELNFFRSSVGNILQLHSSGDPLTTSTGAYLSSGGMWTNNSSASLQILEGHINLTNLLSTIARLPMYQWRYKQEPYALHLGPVAEDFYDLFHCGKGNKHIAPSDLAAVAVAGVQALNKENGKLREENIMLKTTLADINKRVRTLEEIIEKMSIEELNTITNEN
ncbi:MAG: hypothetical protein OEM26_12805 [Saprospiraceae bacterium]|nr:hypothetical protein [Saprospiraceae bacterium]